MSPRVASIVLSLALGAVAGPAASQSSAPAHRPAGRTGTIVVPDRYLRPWDPITIFFDHDAGPARGGPEDKPERLVKLSPQQPGAFTWLDARTLQFRPAEAWPALTRFRVSVDGQSATLATLMEAPTETLPAAGAEGLEPVEEIALTFATPLDPLALARMLSLELRPLPGVDSAAGRVLSGDDYEIKVVERSSRADSARYVLLLREPIPLGTRALLRLRLALDDRERSAFREIGFSTAEPFRVLRVGCRGSTYPVTPEGSRYTREQAIACPASPRTVVVEFSSTPGEIGPVPARNLVRLSPAVSNLSFATEGRTLAISGDFARDTLYSVSVAPAELKDERGRPLDLRARSELFLHFRRESPFVRLSSSQGFVERLGPQAIPIEGRGQERVDLRIHRVPPFDRSFWPFPDRPLVVDEKQRPPGPGEAPARFEDPTRPISAEELKRQIATLGSPPVSALVTLPLRRDGGAATFGLDLRPHLEKITGRDAPGTYLVGLRDLAGDETRSWMWLQVTDLTLSTVEEPHRVRFLVSSLSTGRPIAGARVRVEGVRFAGRGRWETFGEGETDALGGFVWPAPGYDGISRAVRRIVVEKDGDTLVLDPARPPERYADNQWSADGTSWLQWTVESLVGRGPQDEALAHLFTERPVYRPEEEVHIKGYLRTREGGHLKPIASLAGFVVVQGPGDLAWRYPVTTSELGSFYQRFQEKDLPTGTFTAHFETTTGANLGQVAFRVEAYRVPRFEVRLHGPDTASLDRAFEVSLTASYYAGGKVSGQPVAWRVTQFPYPWTPKKRPGFQYSSDARFSRGGRFRASPTLEKEDVTSEAGSATLRLDPSIEPTADPRSYAVEATVTGPDDQTVTATRSFPVLPPFVIGVKAPRFLPRARSIEPEIVVLGPDGEPLPGKPVTLRLLRREWHSHLRASDFGDGLARYTTDVVDVKLKEQALASAMQPTSVPLAIDRAGVYVIEAEARDALGRSQVVSVDLYAGGDEPITWAKPVSRVFSVATDKPRYDPDATAAVVLQSPFQSARALAVVEAPEGNEYKWVDVTGGAATFSLPIKSHWAPRIPVHFVLMRGRVPGTAPLPGNNTDLGKPATMAATAWLEVNPVAHQLRVELTHPQSARPGQTIEVTIGLKDPSGRPLAGEATLWLVDEAVLALGKEQRLDPVPDFVTPVQSHLAVHDTRNTAFGQLPLQESPGGDQGEEPGLLERTTVRRNFKSVPYYNAAIAIGSDGTATVRVKLSDDLTVFKLRAKAVSGPERLGFGTGSLPVRLPVIVQPALPRFVRPGDAFVAAAIGRVVEGSGGPGSAQMTVEGATLDGSGRRPVTWIEGRPERIEFGVEVETPPVGADGRPSYGTVTFKAAVERTADGAADAFEVQLPVRPDRDREVRRVLQDLEADKPLALAAVAEPVRPGTLRRSILLSDQPGLVRMAAGLDYLLSYPYGCTEQQLSRARAYVALRRFRDVLQQSGGEEELARAVKGILEWLPGTIDGDGLVAYWPGSRGYVSLTAWVVQFLVEAQKAGFAVDDKLLRRLTATLQQALRSDYSRFVDGEAFVERAWALAALAQAGQFDEAYAAELARRAQFLNLEAKAQVVQAFARANQSPSALEPLTRALWDGVVFRLFQGKEMYGGLQSDAVSRNALVLPSETRTVAEVTRAVALREPKAGRLPVLVDALVTLGRGDGWGTTNASASALLALAERLEPKPGAGPGTAVAVRLDGREQTLTVGGATPTVALAGSTAEAAEIRLSSAAARPVVARVETSYVPAADGGEAESRSEGFVVTRAFLRVRSGDAPPERVALEKAGLSHTLAIADVIEERVQVVNPKQRHYVAVMVPLAAGLEVLNPALATAPPEARPSGSLTLAPSYVAFRDDHVAFYYDTLPAGTYDFAFRTRATVAGRFVQPPARAEMMYDGAVWGRSHGTRIVVEAKPPATNQTP
jgi:uncharacterized protein YfaS (alpha-2-macroglobulin family)